ncbi:MAG: HupE/UreJ family protein [Parvularculales bacterium]
MTKRDGVCLFVFLGLVMASMVLASLPAGAHTKSRSFSSWRYQPNGEVVMVFSVPSLQATRLAAIDEAGELETLLNRHLEAAIVVRQDDAACEVLEGARSLRSQEGILRSEMQFRCPHPDSTSIIIENNAFFPLTPSHVHFARLHGSNDGEIRWREVLFTDTARSYSLGVAFSEEGTASSWAGVLSDYIWLGIVHVIGGLDHVAFVIGLLLLCHRLRDVLVAITGFTVGHSITLVLAILQWVIPDPPVVEALIGFTIALVAAEGVALRHGLMGRILPVGVAVLGALCLVSFFVQGVIPFVTWVGLLIFIMCHGFLLRHLATMGGWVPVLSIVFGLIHGFGFAGVLQEIGLPQERFMLSLFSFNVGVEIGQVAIVTLAWAVGRWGATRLAPVHGRMALDGLGSLLCGLGVFWFVGRAFI